MFGLLCGDAAGVLRNVAGVGSAELSQPRPVGLSVGVTARLKDGAKLLYMAVMFMGRVGPVSLAMSLTAKSDDNKRKIMPVGHINVG